MNVLAVDTSSKVCSVAIASDDKIISEKHNVSEREHSQTLMPMIKQSLEDVKMKLNDIDLLSCAIGPRFIHWN